MISATATASDVAQLPPSTPVDDVPIMLTVHLLGLVIGTALIVGLIPAAIVLLRTVT